jgi:hypothetical protein
LSSDGGITHDQQTYFVKSFRVIQCQKLSVHESHVWLKPGQYGTVCKAQVYAIKQPLYACAQDAADAELHFLILHFLAGGPFRAAAASLEDEAGQLDMLPTRLDFEG